MSTSEPFVSVVTPVYNCGPYIAECIESVLNQTYRNFEYLIVNNCSTDNTQEIANSYAQKDSRIRVSNNTEFVGVIANHNNAFNQMSHESKYCKVVSADDWLFAECVGKMVELAEAHPTVGIVARMHALILPAYGVGHRLGPAVDDDTAIQRRSHVADDARATRSGRRGHLIPAARAAPYCSSVTFSIQSTALPSSDS